MCPSSAHTGNTAVEPRAGEPPAVRAGNDPIPVTVQEQDRHDELGRIEAPRDEGQSSSISPPGPAATLMEPAGPGVDGGQPRRAISMRSATPDIVIGPPQLGPRSS
jgi:hypothetical protein